MLLPIEIAVTAEPTWNAPGTRAVPVRLRVRFANRGSRPERLLLMDSVRFTLSDPAGHELPSGAARDATRRGPSASGPVAPGRVLSLEREAWLERHGGGIRLVGEDGFGGRWWIEGLTLGDWRLRVRYDNEVGGAAAADAPWRGRLVSRPRVVRVVAPTP